MLFQQALIGATTQTGDNNGARRINKSISLTMVILLFIHIGLIYFEFKRYSIWNEIVFIKTGSQCCLCSINITFTSYGTIAIVLIYDYSVCLLSGTAGIADRDDNNNNNNNDNINVELSCIGSNNANEITRAISDANYKRKAMYTTQEAGKAANDSGSKDKTSKNLAAINLNMIQDCIIHFWYCSNTLCTDKVCIQRNIKSNGDCKCVTTLAEMINITGVICIINVQ